MLVSTLPVGVMGYLVVASPSSAWQLTQPSSLETGATTTFSASRVPAVSRSVSRAS